MRASTLRGVSLGGTLLAVAVLSLLAFTLAGLCVTHLRLSSHQDRGMLASNAARSAVSAAIAKVLEENDFGKNSLAEQEIRINFGETEGFLTFNPATAEARKMLYSTNNLDGNEDAPGAEGSLVPSGTIHLFAIGKSGDTVRRVEAVLRVPPFPWAIASGGRIETKNGVVVGCLPEGASLPAALEDLQPADIVANGTQSNAVFLGSQSFILGDVETPGQVVLGPSPVDIRGEIRNGSSPVKLPTLHPTDYDPQAVGKTHFDLSSGEGVEELTGSARAAESITFSQPLTLDNAQLYVDGNLTLLAGVRGTGILVATGDITIQGGAQLEGATELAVISGGRVQLRGTGADGSVIRGLFYAQQGLEAAELTLVGSLLTGNASTGITLDQVNVYYEEQPIITTTSESGLPEGDYNVGRIHLTTSIEAGRPLIQEWFKDVGEPLPNETDPVFRVRMEPTNGGFPLRITFVPGGFVNLSERLPPFTLNGTDDWDSAEDRIRAACVLELSEAGISGNPLDPGWATRLWQTMLGQMGQAVKGTSGGGSSQPTISLVGDISRFLPIEDRIRVVSWVEQ